MVVSLVDPDVRPPAVEAPVRRVRATATTTSSPRLTRPSLCEASGDASEGRPGFVDRTTVHSGAMVATHDSVLLACFRYVEVEVRGLRP